MTAVDHAELKRLADELVQMLAPDQGESAHPAFGHAVRIQNAHATLLSEIEGLKAERDEAMTLDKGFYEWMIERDLLARGEEVDWSDIVVALTEHEIECCPDPLRTQAPDSWRPDRELPKVEFHQHDWTPAFAALLPDATMPGPQSTAFCVLNLAAFLGTVHAGDLPREDLPYFLAETMMHEIIHVLEQWAGVEFNEERVEALLEKYAALRPQTAESGK